MPATKIPHEHATDAGLDQALAPFLDRFVREDKRTKAQSHIARREWPELMSLIDTRRGRALTPGDGSLDPWHQVRGVFLVGRDAYALTTEEAMKLRTTGVTLFVAYGATFAVSHDHHGAPLLLT